MAGPGVVNEDGIFLGVSSGEVKPGEKVMLLGKVKWFDLAILVFNPMGIALEIEIGEYVADGERVPQIFLIKICWFL